MRRNGHSAESIEAALQICNTQRCRPPLEKAEVARIARSVARYEPDERAQRGIESDAGSQRKTVVITRGVDVRMRPIEWAWPGRLALGKLAMLVGHPETSKSTITCDLAARITTGRDWPDGAKNTLGPRGVVLVSAEDDVEDTIMPRFLAAGGDPERITFIEGVPLPSGEGEDAVAPWTIERGAALESAIRQTPDCAFVVIDPVSAFMPRQSNEHCNADVRAALRIQADVAERTGVAVLVVSHLRKNGEGEAILKTLGSLAYVAAARSVFGVCRDKSDETGATRLFVPIKNNLAPKGLSIPFVTIAGSVPGFEGLQPPVIAWDDPVECDANDVMGPDHQARDAPAQNDAADFLAVELGDGPVGVKELLKRGANAGHSKRTLERAKKRLGVVASKKGMDGGWEWTLPGWELSADVGQ